MDSNFTMLLITAFAWGMFVAFVLTPLLGFTAAQMLITSIFGGATIGLIFRG